MSLTARIVFAPIWVPFWVLDKVVTFMSPRNAAIIAGDIAEPRYIGHATVAPVDDDDPDGRACELTQHSNDDHFHLWELDLKGKETDR